MPLMTELNDCRSGDMGFLEGFGQDIAGTY